MTPMLPVEIVDEIAGLVINSNHCDSIMNLSLTCRYFTATCQQFLFRHIQLEGGVPTNFFTQKEEVRSNRPTFETFAALLSDPTTNPFISTYVKTLEIVALDDYLPSFQNRAVAQVFRGLFNVITFELVLLDAHGEDSFPTKRWRDLPLCFHDSFYRFLAFNPIERLKFHRVLFIPFHLFGLSRTRTIQDLELRDCSPAISEDFPLLKDPSTFELVPLAHLHFYSMGFPLTVNYLERVFDLSNLRFLDVDIVRYRDALEISDPFLPELLSRLLNLEYLAIEIETLGELSLSGMIFPKSGCHSFISLRSISICVRATWSTQDGMNFVLDPFFGIHEELSALSQSPALEEVSFTLCLGSNGCLNTDDGVCTALERTFGERYGFPALRSLGITVVLVQLGQNNAAMDESEKKIKELITKSLDWTNNARSRIRSLARVSIMRIESTMTRSSLSIVDV